MDWYSATSTEDLKRLGAYLAVRKCAKTEIEAFQLGSGISIQFKPSGWNGLFEAIQAYKKVQKSLGDKSSEAHVSDDYFHSKKARYIFSLLELDGEDRNRQLGLAEKHLRDKNAASKWMRAIAREIHPDKIDDPQAEKATQKLNELYELLTY